MEDLIRDLLSAATYREQLDVFDVAANALAVLRCKNDARKLQPASCHDAATTKKSSS